MRQRVQLGDGDSEREIEVPDQATLLRLRRLQLAREVAAVYGPLAEVAAVLVVGSVARGWADRWSDVELLICWTELPVESRRVELAAACGGTNRQAWPADPELGVLEEQFDRDGIKVELLHVPVREVDAVIEAVTDGGDTSARKHMMVAAIRDAMPLVGEDWLGPRQSRAMEYPVTLQRAMIEQHLAFGPHWWLRMLAGRGDLLALAPLLGRIAQALLGIALAVNRTCAVSNDGKWAFRMAAALATTPERFAARLERILVLPATEAVEEAISLIDDTLALVARHVPDIDVGPVRARVEQARGGG